MTRVLRSAVVGVVLLSLLGLAHNGSAQTGLGRLIGTVADPQRAVLPGVLVTVTSPALIGQETTVTEGDGRYLFPALPSGVYIVTFELASFQTFTRQNIVITLATTITVDAQLDLATLAENVVVTGASPLVDLTTQKVGVHFGAKVLASVPSATDMWALLAQTPGIRMLDFDVGGSRKSTQSQYEGFGISDQNRILSDGVDTTEGLGGAGMYADYYANQEDSVSAVGNDVEMNTPGVVVSSTVKSGGNELKGFFHLSYDDARFVGSNLDAELVAHGASQQGVLTFWEGHADLGGPIVKDKVWFFGAINHFTLDKEVSGVPRAVATDLGLFNAYTTKETYRPSAKDTLIGYLQTGQKLNPNFGVSVLMSPDSLARKDARWWVYKGEHQRAWTNRLFTEARVGAHKVRGRFTPSVDPAEHPHREDLATGFVSGASSDYVGERSKPQVTARATYFRPGRAGSHDFKFGFEYLYDGYRFGYNGLAGPIRYQDRDGQTSEIVFRDLGTPKTLNRTWTDPEEQNLRYALYAQDRWTPGDRLTMTVGVRMDYQKPSNGDATRDPILTDFFSPKTTPGRTLLTTADVAPRVGLAYRVDRQGKSVLKAFYGRYYHNFADSFTGANPGGFNTQVWEFNDQNGNRVYDGVQELGREIDAYGGDSTNINSGLKTPYTDEINASFEQQFWGESSARATYVRKITRRAIPIYTVGYAYNWIGHLTVPTTATAESDQFGTETFQLVDIPESLYGQGLYRFDNIPGGGSTYDTVEVALEKRFTGRYFIQSSFDYLWRDEIVSLLNPNPAVPDRQGTTEWQGRLLGHCTLAHEFGAAVNLRYQSGYPYARSVATGLPGLGDVTVDVERRSRHRSGTVTLLDLRVDKAFHIGRYQLTTMFDLFNALNSNTVTGFSTNSENFGLVFETLDPITAQVGVTWEF